MRTRDTWRVTGPNASAFVGRSSELKLLLGAAAGSDTGVTLWLVAGDAGVGKTRLVDEVMARTGADAATIGRGSCRFTAQGALPFVAVTEALAALAAAHDPATTTDVLRSHPDLAVVLPDRSGSGDATRDANHDASDDGSRLRLFDAIATLLERMSDIRPVCVVLEDLHWAEPSTRDLIAYLVGRVADRPVAIVGTYRSDDVARTHPLRAMLAELDRNPRVRHLSLQPFDHTELAEFASGRLDGQPTARTLDELAQRSGGNAFYASELIDAISTGRGGVRTELFDLILARVASLSDAAQDTLHLLAAGGGSVRDELLAAVAQRDEEALDASLSEAIEHHVVVLNDNGTLAFRHALMQEAVYSTLLPRQRRRKHERYADVLLTEPQLAESPESEAAELAWHLREARRFDEAFRASLQAADAAESILAFSEAVEHIDQALDLWDEASAAQSHPCSHADVLQRAARLAHFAGNSPRAVQYQRAALAEAADRTPSERAMAHSALGTYLHTAGESVEALDELRIAEALIPAEPPSAERAAVLAVLGRLLMLTMGREDPRPVLTEAIDAARHVGARDTLGDALSSLASTELHAGHYQEGVDLMLEAREHAIATGDVIVAVRSFVNLSSGLTLLGDLPEAQRVGREGLAYLAASRHPDVHGFFIASNLCETLSEMGRWNEAAELTRTTRRPEGVLPTTWTLHHSLTSALRQGHFDQSQSIVDSFEVATLAEVDPQAMYAFWSGVAQLAVALDDEPRARRAITEALAWTRCLGHTLLLRSLTVQLAARRAEGGDREAIAEAQHELELMEASVSTTLGEPDPRSHRLLALLHQARAEEAACRGVDARTHWEAAVAEWGAGGFGWQHANAWLRLGECQLRQGDRSAATESLRTAKRLADDMGARPLADESGQLLAHAGLAPGEPATNSAAQTGAAPNHLTERELAVLRLLAEGRTNRQIGEELYMSPKTASVHVSRILAKLGVENRTEAAAAGRRAGLVG